MDFDFSHVAKLGVPVIKEPSKLEKLVAELLRDVPFVWQRPRTYINFSEDDKFAMLLALEAELHASNDCNASFNLLPSATRQRVAEVPEILEILLSHGITSLASFGRDPSGLCHLCHASALLFLLYTEIAQGKVEQLLTNIYGNEDVIELEEMKDSATQILLYVDSVRNILNEVGLDEGEVAGEILEMLFVELNIMDYYNAVDVELKYIELCINDKDALDYRNSARYNFYKQELSKIYDAHSDRRDGLVKGLDVERILQGYEGDEHSLYEQVCMQYNVCPKQNPFLGDLERLPDSESAYDYYKHRLEKIYQIHNHSKIRNVIKLLRKYAGKERELYEMVQRKYLLESKIFPKGKFAHFRG